MFTFPKSLAACNWEGWSPVFLRKILRTRAVESGTTVHPNLVGAWADRHTRTALGGPALAESPLIVGASDEQNKKYLGRMTEVLGQLAVRVHD